VWLEQRARGGLFGGLWEPPSVAIDVDGDASRSWSSLLAERAIGAVVLPCSVVRRTLTHRDLVFHVGVGTAAAASTSTSTSASIGRWLLRNELGDVGVSSSVMAVLEAAWPSPQPQLDLL
jgi:adenine-specific DNA glycosylase